MFGRIYKSIVGFVLDLIELDRINGRKEVYKVLLLF